MVLPITYDVLSGTLVEVRLRLWRRRSRNIDLYHYNVIIGVPARHILVFVGLSYLLTTACLELVGNGTASGS
jgi:hypothetical protein